MKIISLFLLINLSFITIHGQSISDFEELKISNSVVINEKTATSIINSNESLLPILGFYTTLSDFNNAVSLNCSDIQLTFEDFFRPSLQTLSCGPVVSSAGDNCYDPGILPDGFAVSVSNGTNVSWIPIQTFGNSIPYVGPGSFAQFAVITFDPPVYAIAMEYISTQEGDSNIRVFGAGGTQIDAIDYFTDNYESTFFGIIEDEPITKIEIEAPNGGGELIGQFRYGADCSTCEVTMTVSGAVGSGTYVVSDAIYSDGIIGAVENVTFQGSNINLEPGFNVRLGAMFLAEIGTCDPVTAAAAAAAAVAAAIEDATDHN